MWEIVQWSEWTTYTYSRKHTTHDQGYGILKACALCALVRKRIWWRSAIKSSKMSEKCCQHIRKWDFVFLSGRRKCKICHPCLTSNRVRTSKQVACHERQPGAVLRARERFLHHLEKHAMQTIATLRSSRLQQKLFQPGSTLEEHPTHEFSPLYLRCWIYNMRTTPWSHLGHGKICITMAVPLPQAHSATNLGARQEWPIHLYRWQSPIPSSSLRILRFNYPAANVCASADVFL